MKKKKVCSVLLIMIMIMLLYVQPVMANEDAITISDNIQSQIDRLEKEDPSNKDYIDAVMVNFYEDINTNSNDLNQYLSEVIESLDTLKVSSDEVYSNVVKKQEETMKSTPQTKAGWEDAYISAAGNYAIGISIVRRLGCPNTANYMDHAIVPKDKVFTSWTPETVYHRNDSWAKTLTRNQAFADVIFGRFEQEILMSGTSYGTIGGSFAFTTGNSSLDAFAALHNVQYSATFTKNSLGYSVAYKLTDTYDFEWSKYDNFAIGFGNNYCHMMQSNGWIKPFQIVITSNG